MALHCLRQPKPHTADLVFAGVVAWLLETLSFHERKARIHQEAAQKIYEASDIAARGQSLDDFVFDDKLQSLLWNIYRFRCLRCKTPEPVDEDGHTELAVALRNTDTAAVGADDIYDDFRDFVSKFRPDLMREHDVVQAREWAARRERSIIQTRYRASEPQVIFTAFHLLANTIILLSPGPVLHPVAGDATLGIAIDYTTDQCYWLAHSANRQENAKDMVSEVILMMLQLIATYGPSERHRMKARDMLLSLKRTGKLENPEWVLP